MTPSQAKRLADQLGISYSTNDSAPYPTIKQLVAFGKAAANAHVEARRRLSEELRDVVDWARVEKAPLRKQEIDSIVKVLEDYGL